ncbi:keratinocyte differentiation factor 1 [Gadus macrocephalus]|uniref:keratinocyte differentiation factor 1 n=1 Tax=Gadus macrocephalus TaxID=80720 RepID=UPI0028CB2AB8|nr:keratinocyte differentiation factor 1 [Gadus macrocephalus]
MPGHNTGASHTARHHKAHIHSSRTERYRQDRNVSRENNTSQESYKDPHHGEHTKDPQHSYPSRYSENPHGRRGHARNTNGRGSETIGFIPGSADNAAGGRHSCGSCTSIGWGSCKSLICCVLTCGFYGSREPCLPVNESTTDPPSKPGGGGGGEAHGAHGTNGMNLSNPTSGIAVEPARPVAKPSKLPTSDSFRYPDVRIGGHTVVYPYPAPKHAHKTNKGNNNSQRPVSDTSVYSREDLDLDDLSDTGTDIDSLITKKLLELYALHQIDQLAKCTSDSSFSRKTNEISELIYSIAQDYNLEKQEAECKLVHGVIRISTRKSKRNKNPPLPSAAVAAAAPQRPYERSDRTLPDSGNETMTFMSSDMPEVKVSELTSSDELARKMRYYSGRTLSSGSYQQDTQTDSSGAPLLEVL